MPSPRHDSLNQLFRDRPELAAEILRDFHGVDLPAQVSARVESNDFNTRPSDDFTPDTVITIGPPQLPHLGTIVEIQQEKNESKRRQLTRYAAQLWLLLKRPVEVLIICPNHAAAEFFAEPVETTLPGYVFRANVLGPALIPVITDPTEAAAYPELAVLSVMAHGTDWAVSRAFIGSLSSMEPEHALQYSEYCYAVAGPAVRRILEELMSSTTWPVYSPFAKEHFGKGMAEGEAKGEAKAILAVLSARGLACSPGARERITSCTDADLLLDWVKRAATADTVDELFD